MRTRPLEVVLSPVDNQRLANLCGALDENLRQIEAAYDVAIARRGEHFSVRGHPNQSAQAAAALQHFYSEAAEHLSIDAIQLGLVELGQLAERGQANQPGLLTRKPELHGRTPRQVQYLRQIQAHDITFGIGPAGTGKTYLAVACAVAALEREEVRRLILARPAVEAGEKLGFLPGDMAQKVDPYLRPLYDALYEMLGFERVAKLMERNIIEVAPLAFMRGRTLNDSFIILDEAQNTTVEQIKMFLTRVGFGSKAVVTGDITQIDLPRNKESGLRQVLEVLREVDGISFTFFTAQDVVRHPLVQRIVSAYEAYEREHPSRYDAPPPRG
ncbi:PhoH-like protein [Burkholderiales bacterium]|nr:PhoH-like protein [Burkholderiales bacterium]